MVKWRGRDASKPGKYTSSTLSGDFHFPGKKNSLDVAQLASIVYRRETYRVNSKHGGNQSICKTATDHGDGH